MKKHIIYWIKHFKQDKKFGHLRFKLLEDKGYGGYPPFDIDESLVDKVKLDDFVKIEKNRIPFFVGTPISGINPWINKIPNFFNGPKIIAILGRSSFNSECGGLSIEKVYKDNKRKWFRLARFENRESCVNLEFKTRKSMKRL